MAIVLQGQSINFKVKNKIFQDNANIGFWSIWIIGANMDCSSKTQIW